MQSSLSSCEILTRSRLDKQELHLFVCSAAMKCNYILNMLTFD